MTTPPLRRATDLNLVEAYAQRAAARAAAELDNAIRAIAHAEATRPLTFIEWLDGQSR